MTVSHKHLGIGSVFLGAWMAGFAGAEEYFVPDWSSYVGYDFNADKVNAVATDSATNSFLGGFLGDWWIHNSAGDDFFGESSGFVAQVTPDGSLAWATDLHAFGNYHDEVKGLAYGTPAKLAAAGVTVGSLADPGTYAFACSLSASNGVINWVQKIGQYGGTNSFNAVAMDADGYVYTVGHTSVSGLVCNVTGYQVGGVTYGKAFKGNIDALIVKWSPTGSVVWRHYLGGVNVDTANACAVTPDGFVYVAGETRSPDWASLASGTPGATNSAGFIVKLTADGTHIWSSFLNGSSDEAVQAVQADAATATLFLGGVTASSNFLSSVTRLNSHAGNSDGFIVKLTDTNTAFRTEWCRFAGGSAADRVASVALLPDGRLAAGGATGSGAWLTQTGGGTFHGVQDGFLTLLNATNGAVSWSAYVGGERADQIQALAAGPGPLFTVGSTFSTNWISGGFWDTWSKDEGFGGGDFGFIVKWDPGVPTPPSITVQPVDLSVREGSPATFSVTAAGSAPLTYRWFRNDMPVTGLTSNKYTIVSAAFGDNGATYSCLVSNVAGTVTSRAATLTVKAMGVLTATLAPAEAAAQGAKWSVNAGASWLTSGGSTNVEVGPYTITFTNLTGWITPAPVSGFQVLHGVTNSVSGVYTAILPSGARVITGTNVTVTVHAPAGLSTWTLVETLQAGLTPTNITAGGVWNGAARTLTFSGTDATTNTLSYAVLCVTSGVYTISGTVTPHPANVPVTVTGDSRVIKGNLIRTISGSSVTLTVYQPSASFVWSVEEMIPAGLTPTNMAGPNVEWDSANRVISWYRKGVGVTLTYEVTGAPGTYILTGEGQVTAAGVEPIFGDTELTIPGVEIPPPDIIGFSPVAGTNTFTLAFTSIVNQAYMILTNATLGVTNGWSMYLQVPGAAGTTQREVPMTGPRLFYRVRAVE